jgi:DNA polymerase-1
MITEKKLFLLDAYALIFRAYYAFIKNPRYNSKGLNTSAVLGFTNTLYEVISIEKPSHIAVVFDPPTPTFRSELFPAYKANRDATPEDIIKSVPYIKKIIDGFNIPIIEIAGFEADDAIGTLAKKAEKKGFITYMMTPDKDFGQLVSDKIFIYKPRLSSAEHEILGIKEICEKYGIDHPEQVIDILAIWGDAADNVPGIQGIGEKTSSALIQKYKSVEGIYEHINELKGKQKENFENGRETVQLSKKLVSISLDVPVEFDEALFKFSAPDYKILDVLFKELEFNALSKRIIPDDNPKAIQGNLFTENETIVESIPENKIFKDITNTTHRYVLIENEQDLSALVLELNKRNEFCFDTETTGTDPHRAEWIGISFSFNKHEAYYIPVSPEKSKIELIVKALKPVLEHESIKKVGQNIKYDIIVLARYGITVKGALFDTMIAHYLLDPSARHNLNNLAEIYLNYRPVPIEDLIGKRGKDQLSMRQISIDRVKEYAGEDADITFQLKDVLELEL